MAIIANTTVVLASWLLGSAPSWAMVFFSCWENASRWPNPGKRLAKPILQGVVLSRANRRTVRGTTRWSDERANPTILPRNKSGNPRSPNKPSPASRSSNTANARAERLGLFDSGRESQPDGSGTRAWYLKRIQAMRVDSTISTRPTRTLFGKVRIVRAAWQSSVRRLAEYE